MMIAKQYSAETIEDAKRFVKNKGKRLAYLLGRQKRIIFGWE